MEPLETTIAQLAVEYWRLLRVVSRAVDLAPEDAKERLMAPARYAITRFEQVLLQQKMSIQDFDGWDFEANLPVSPINKDDFTEEGPLVVERTIEPAVIRDMRVIMTGKVLLARKS